jgi:hypothetical protein
MKIIFSLFLLLIAPFAFANLSPAAPTFSDIVKDKDGTPLFYVQSSEWYKPWPPWYEEVKGKGALEYCARHGMHLPSIREFAELASRPCTPEIKGRDACGAAGISESAKDGYHLIVVKDDDGMSTDYFYYSSAGYSRAAGNLGFLFFWSSSDESSSTNTGYTFDAESGEIDAFNSRAAKRAFRCAHGR